MTNIITTEELNEFKEASTRTIKMPDGSPREVRMTPHLWETFDALTVLEGCKESEIAAFAEEEVQLQGFSFDTAYRCIVVYLANRWTR